MEAVKKYSYDPDYAIPPGITLKETMESLDMSQKELAVRTGLTVQSLNRIFKGEQPLTYETANRLELATGVPAGMWNNLEAQYREQLAKIEEQQRLEIDLDWLKSIPTRELMDRGAIPATKKRVSMLRETLKFYGVSSVASWREIWEMPEVAARRSPCFKSRPGPASAWIRLGEIQSHAIGCSPFNLTAFKQALQPIRQLIVHPPETFVPEMRRLCADAGVALALVPEMKKVPWSGATRWLSPAKAMILLNLRGKSEDLFWFAFFHEAGHVVANDSKKEIFINDGSQKDPRERKANDFAAEILIPPTWNDRIRNLSKKKEVQKIANELGVTPGIVVGRFQYLTKKWNYFNDMKCNFQWRKHY